MCVANTRASGACHAALPQQEGKKEEGVVSENIFMILWAALLPGALLVGLAMSNWDTISRALVASVAFATG